MVIGAYQVRRGAQTLCCLAVRPVGKESSPAPQEVNSVAEGGFSVPLKMSENPLGGHFSGLEEKSMRASDAAAGARTTTRIDETREFDEFVSLTTTVVPVSKTILMMDYIQGTCRQVFKEENPTKLRNPSAGLTSKAPKFGRGVFDSHAAGTLRHVLDFLAEKSAKRQKEPDENQGKAIMRR
jgi:hypothetical protein